MGYRFRTELLLIWFCAANPSVRGKPQTHDSSLRAQEPGVAMPGVVRKTVYSSKMRMLFAVGLEGTGHHGLFHAIDRVFTENPDLVQMNECRMFAPYYLVDAMTKTASHYNEAIKTAREQMRHLADKEQTLSSPGSVATIQGGSMMHPSKCNHGGGMLSYPNLRGTGKVMQYIDVRQLAEVAEAEGVDLRVVFLQRSAEGIVNSTTVHRHFQNFIGDNERTTPEERYMEYMRILLTEIAVVHSLLEEIDPAFVVCHKFDLSEDSEQASKVAEFVSPNEAISQLLADSMVEQARGYNHVDLASPFEGAENVTARLQRKLDVLDARYC